MRRFAALSFWNWRKASGMIGMAGGQMLDIEAEAGVAQTLDSIIRIQAHKTGALFRFASQAGAIMAGADPHAAVALCR